MWQLLLCSQCTSSMCVQAQPVVVIVAVGHNRSYLTLKDSWPASADKLHHGIAGRQCEERSLACTKEPQMRGREEGGGKKPCLYRRTITGEGGGGVCGGGCVCVWRGGGRGSDRHNTKIESFWNCHRLHTAARSMQCQTSHLESSTSTCVNNN